MGASDFPERELYYITHVDNLPSILKNGVLSHEIMETEKIKHKKIYDNEIVVNRSKIVAPNKKDLWSFANLYFQARNPMLYRVIFEQGANNIAILGINKSILNKDDIYVTNGNAASSYSEIREITQLSRTYSEIKESLDKEYWSKIDNSFRKIMAEILVPNMVPPEYITDIYVPNHEEKNTSKVVS